MMTRYGYVYRINAQFVYALTEMKEDILKQINVLRSTRRLKEVKFFTKRTKFFVVCVFVSIISNIQRTTKNNNLFLVTTPTPSILQPFNNLLQTF